MKISIITVCKNPGESIKRTVESVLSQTYKDIEYIIVDGASTDGTVEGIRDAVHTYTGEHAGSPLLKFVSEPDMGIYNAMNKGIGLATGDVIYFLNAGDRLFNESVVEKVMNEFVQSGADFIYTDIFCEDERSGYVKKFDRVDRYFLFRDCISHQASFYKKEVFEKIGHFDEEYKLAADYDSLMKMWNDNKIRKKYLNTVSAFYNLKGVSSLSKENVVKERKSIQKKRFPSIERVLYGFYFYQLFRRRLRKAGFKIHG